jgi:hypothetical protein
LLGLVRHLAGVEHAWFRRFIGGQQDLPRLYKSPDDGDLDFNGAIADDAVVAEAWETWRGEVAHAREVYAALDDPGALVGPEDNRAEVRDVVVHMIEEYARHCGHADLLRERIDGRVGQLAGPAIQMRRPTPGPRFGSYRPADPGGSVRGTTRGDAWPKHTVRRLSPRADPLLVVEPGRATLLRVLQPFLSRSWLWRRPARAGQMRARPALGSRNESDEPSAWTEPRQLCS